MIWLLFGRKKLFSGLFSRLILEDFCLNCEKTCLGFRVSHVSTRIMSAVVCGIRGRYGLRLFIGEVLWNHSSSMGRIVSNRHNLECCRKHTNSLYFWVHLRWKPRTRPSLMLMATWNTYNLIFLTLRHLHLEESHIRLSKQNHSQCGAFHIYLIFHLIISMNNCNTRIIVFVILEVSQSPLSHRIILLNCGAAENVRGRPNQIS